MIKYYILFPNHSNGIKLNVALRHEGIESTIAPAPRELSNCCGVSLIIKEEDIPLIKKIIVRDKIEILKISGIENKNNPKRDCYC